MNSIQSYVSAYANGVPSILNPTSYYTPLLQLATLWMSTVGLTIDSFKSTNIPLEMHQHIESFLIIVTMITMCTRFIFKWNKVEIQGIFEWLCIIQRFPTDTSSSSSSSSSTHKITRLTLATAVEFFKLLLIVLVSLSLAILHCPKDKNGFDKCPKSLAKLLRFMEIHGISAVVCDVICCDVMYWIHLVFLLVIISYVRCCIIHTY